MKNLIKLSLKVALLTFGFSFISCEEESIINSNNEYQHNDQDNNRAAQADVTIEGAFNIMENGYVEIEEGRNQANSLFSNCTTITIEPDANGGGVITLDFGDGCILNNGANVTGSMLIEYGAFIAGTRTINYSYNNFTYNQNSVTGGGEIFRQIANANGNPQSTVNETIVVGFPNTDVTATRTGTRVVVWVEGFGSGTWLDNVYHVTGNWDTQFTNGFFRNGVVTQTLIRKLNCAYIGSGKLEVTQNNFTGSIDWGDGTCDNQATIEINGQLYDILL